MTCRNSEINERFVNPDLTKERKGASFCADEMTYIFDGGRRRTLRRRDIETAVFSDPVLQKFSLDKSIFKSAEETYNAAVARAVRLYELGLERNWTSEDDSFAKAAVRGSLAFGLHWIMFIPTIARLGTPEQRDKWLPLAQSLKIIGCYCQTEVGHGSNLRELETVARYDPASEEFVLNTPKPSSIKWWPGGMGKTATHAVLFAQLEIGNKKYGFHAFIVPIRSRVDHKPLPGVSVGQIGPLMSLVAFDNGYLSLNGVRIPRENLLMKNGTVTREGKYISSASKQANYAALVFGRVGIVSFTLHSFKLSVTTAVRYSAVRRQSSMKPGDPECQILDYQTQQYKLFPAIALAYGMFFVSQRLKQRYSDVTQEKEASRDDFQELHIIISGLKALNSDLPVKYAAVCLRACGGHGYMLASGQPQALSAIIAQTIVEGENTVMYLQVARYLLKMMNYLHSGHQLTHSSVKYLNNLGKAYMCPLLSLEDCLRPEVYTAIYEQRAASLLMATLERMKSDTKSGMSPEEALSKNQQALVHCAQAHCFLMEIKDYIEAIKEYRLGKNLKAVLTHLCLMFAINQLLEQHGAVSSQHVTWLRQTEVALMTKIRPEAVVLVDAFDIHDKTLSSAIGSYDGRAYENLYQSAMQDPINQQQVHSSYETFLRKYLSAKL